MQVPDEPQAWPILQCKNVFVLPGVPELFSSKLDSIATHFLEGGAPSLARRVLLAVAEDSIVHELNAVVREHSAVASTPPAPDGKAVGRTARGAYASPLQPPLRPMGVPERHGAP